MGSCSKMFRCGLTSEMSKSLLIGIIKEVVGRDAIWLSLSRNAIIEIVQKYIAQLPKNKIDSHRVKIAYSKGYKAGYMMRSDELYEKAMFDMWKKCIAGPTEKKACFNDHARFAEVENLEIVEPKVIIK